MLLCSGFVVLESQRKDALFRVLPQNKGVTLLEFSQMSGLCICDRMGGGLVAEGVAAE